MSYQPDSKLIDWPDERRFSELVAQHRSGFCAGTEQPMPAEAATDIGHEDGELGPEDDPWLVLATLIGAIAGMLLSVMFPSGFQVLP